MKIEDFNTLYKIDDVDMSYNGHNAKYDKILSIDGNDKINIMEFAKDYTTDIYRFEWHGNYEFENDGKNHLDYMCDYSDYDCDEGSAIKTNGFGVLLYDANHEVGASISVSSDEYWKATPNAHGSNNDYYRTIDGYNVITLADCHNEHHFISEQVFQDDSHEIHTGHYIDQSNHNISVDLFDF